MGAYLGPQKVGECYQTDFVVLDEAQDILTSANLDALNEMLRGGLHNGRWCFFLDGREQAKVYGKMEDEALQRLTALGVRERLTLNCRNTRPIARQTAVVSNSKWRTYPASVDTGLGFAHCWCAKCSVGALPH